MLPSHNQSLVYEKAHIFSYEGLRAEAFALLQVCQNKPDFDYFLRIDCEDLKIIRENWTVKKAHTRVSSEALLDGIL